jgi:hypothetical protein
VDYQTVEDLRRVTGNSDHRSLAICIETSDDLVFSPLAELRNLEVPNLMHTEISAARLKELRELLPAVRVTAHNHPNDEEK